jgi:hypothetical protein
MHLWYIAISLLIVGMLSKCAWEDARFGEPWWYAISIFGMLCGGYILLSNIEGLWRWR